MRRRLASALAAAGLLLTVALRAGAVSPPLPATPPDYVVDLAGVIDAAAAARLSALLRGLEERTGAQVLVLTVRSLEGESLEDFSLDVAHNRWKLGQKGKDNGVLITLALQERRYRIEVGYGLEAVLPDSAVGSIGRELLVPAFRAGDYGGGLVAAAGEIAARIAQAAGAQLPEAPGVARAPAARGRAGQRAGPLQVAFMVLAGIVFLWLLIRHPQLLIWLLLTSRGGGRGSWGGGGGGFGGGGGGGFGGGGSSGSW
ncbi:MAG TPA: TPM domain-containing protein [bacterium]